MSFTAGALLHRESVLIAEQYAQDRDWAVTRQAMLDKNLLQARTVSTSKRFIREIVQRLQTLTQEQLLLVCNGSEEEQKHILWLAICKRYQFIREFAIEIVRERYLQLGSPIARSDYESFFTAKAAWHPELEGFGQATRDKLRQNLFKMLREAGLLSNDGHVMGAFLSSSVVRAIAEESAENLMIFPVREEDVERWAVQ